MEEKLVTLTIDGKEVTVPANYTVLQAANKLGINIPRLCFLKGVHENSNCRICVVEIEGQRTLKNSCTMPITDGMVVKTNTPRVRKSVTENLKLLAANHVFECWRCPREHNCEFLTLLRKYNIQNDFTSHNEFLLKTRKINGNNPAIELDSGKCILCGRCISTCEKLSGLSILAFNNRGSKTIVGPALLHEIGDSGCIFCGKCIQACPTGAIHEKSDIDKVLEEIQNPDKFVVVQAAPAVRAALSEEFGYPIGTDAEGKMYAAFKALGFDEIADVNWAADLTIMEEGFEFMGRLQNGGKFPMFTSCSPGWIRFIEQYEPSYLENLSSCKSPHQMGGAMIKSYWAKKLKIDPKKIVVVSIMPCIAKKYEASRPEMEVDGLRDVDYVLTTRELARMIRREEIDYNLLEEIKPEGELAKYTGAGAIFGVTGGVMEAALRTVVETLTKKPLDKIDFECVRGMQEIKEATLNVNGIDVNVAVVHGGKAIKEFFEILKKGEKQYHFVEFMGCVGGCINGGGQPIINARIQDTVDYKALRASVLYNEDTKAKIRKSHENESILTCYKEFLGKPNSEVSHKYLHTHYSKKTFYNEA
ncbi:MAG: [FeFe] hydrogenase, group A [Acholeplasmatales bacterium]|nr:[FeFe] hydrogenase, group A [Acholeplasmatales bacterium]